VSKFFRDGDMPKRDPQGAFGPGVFATFGSTRPVRNDTVNSGDGDTDDVINDLRTAVRKLNALARDSGQGR
jgi:hypothetical protein